MTEEYIEREAAIDALQNHYEVRNAVQNGIMDECVMLMMRVPAADVVPVRHGHWVWNPNGMDWGLGAWVCSECHAKPETWWEADKKNKIFTMCVARIAEEKPCQRETEKQRYISGTIGGRRKHDLYTFYCC